MIIYFDTRWTAEYHRLLRSLTLLPVSVLQLAENAPAVFNVHVKPFIEVIWSGLRDAKVYVREASVDALRVRGALLLTRY